MEKTLIVLLGATGVGKTAFSLPMAEILGTPIISADSRQVFREIPIGTAAPTEKEQKRVRHYFVGTKSVAGNYNAGEYEADAIGLINNLFLTHDTLLLTGGSMLYIDAVCKGLDDIPHVSEETRRSVGGILQTKGLGFLQAELQRLDPAYYQQADLQNPQRVAHAIEVCLESGKPYSSFRKGFTHHQEERPFRILKAGLQRDREKLYQRINQRVDNMLEQGLLKEAERVYPWRHKNSLNTVGYKELFRYFDGDMLLDETINLIKQNSRHYAKRQMTWFRRDKDIHWFNAETTQPEDIISLL
ncbi:MAG TPA: tRNA (adenosine(37)-N6)-dimethylallyltransferase MiaA [Bacteroidales bacterium]|nr:tRNA (adenosine(37)-N6)-dimethylallyltransferase MiaA [Bacteroidales bacterium]